MSIWYYILLPFSTLLMWLYETFGSYALALVLFTLIIKVILFPLSLKGKKSMMQMTALSSRAQQLQKQYGKDKERYNAELTKLYEKAGVNPMGGCLWSLLPMPILIGLYAIIRRPMHYMMGIADDGIQAVANALGWSNYTVSGYNEIALTNMLNDPSNFQLAQAALGDSADRLATIDFSFLGLNLSTTPNWKVWEGPFDWATLGLVLIPVLVAVLSFLSSKVSMKTNYMNKSSQGSGNAAVDKTNRQMMYMMPIMYVWFGFVMPAGMSIYMTANAVFMMVQDLICSKMLRKQFEELEAQHAARELEEKEEEKRRKAERAAERARQAEEAKKNRGKKKPAASDGEKKKNPHNEASRVGIRAYARGRAYDPDRYGGVTPYHDPNEVIDEQAVQQALEAKGMAPAPEEEETEALSGEQAVLTAPAEEAAAEAAVPQEEAAVSEEEQSPQEETEDAESYEEWEEAEGQPDEEEQSDSEDETEEKK